jgi:hypothetical protein
MPRTSEMIPSSYLKRGDIGPGMLVTVRGVESVTFNVGKADEESKWVIHFQEVDKGLSLNNTNIKLLEKICKSDNTDDWTGKQVVLYWDETVSYMDQVVGGIRIRAPKSEAERALPF